jgi:hypothetical protein
LCVFQSWLVGTERFKKGSKRFKRSKERNVPIYDKDIEAIKTLNTAPENASKSYVNDNILLQSYYLRFDRNVHHNGDIID